MKFLIQKNSLFITSLVNFSLCSLWIILVFFPFQSEFQRWSFIHLVDTKRQNRTLSCIMCKSVLLQQLTCECCHYIMRAWFIRGSCLADVDTPSKITVLSFNRNCFWWRYHRQFWFVFEWKKQVMNLLESRLFSGYNHSAVFLYSGCPTWINIDLYRIGLWVMSTVDSWGLKNHFFPSPFLPIRPGSKHTGCWSSVKNFDFQ